jgi:hypothetical protein
MSGSFSPVKSYSVMSALTQGKSPKARNASGSLKHSKEITALDRLKRELGAKVGLLEALPISQIHMVSHNHENLEGYMNQKILLGEVLNKDQVKCSLWAFMTSHTRKVTELPEVNTFAFHPHNDESERYTFDVVIEKAELREEYHNATYNRQAFTALLKVCGKTGSPWS